MTVSGLRVLLTLMEKHGHGGEKLVSIKWPDSNQPISVDVLLLGYNFDFADVSIKTELPS